MAVLNAGVKVRASYENNNHVLRVEGPEFVRIYIPATYMGMKTIFVPVEPEQPISIDEELTNVQHNLFP